MSQPVSAFEAYTNATSSKKKSPSKAAGGKNAGARKPAAKSQAAAKAKQQAARNQNNKPKAVNKKNTKDKSPTGAAVSKAAPAKKHDARKAAPTKSAASKHKTGRATASNGKAAPNGIREDEIDTLVEQLLGDSPSHPKKLTKAQQKKKQELEDYLVHQLELDDKRRAEGGDSDDDDDDDDDDSDDGSSSGSYSNEFSDEYTINSYSDEEEEEDCEEEETQVSSCSSAESTDEGASQSTAAVKSKTNGTAATKRKSGAAVNGATDAKQSKAMEKAAKAANSRKSLPAAKPDKTSERRRHSVGESADVNVPVNAVDAQTVKLEPLSPPSSAVKMNSIKEGEKAFGWLLSPLSVKDFFAKYWEAAACLVKRKKDNFYSHLISFEAIDQMLLKHHVEFTKNIDVTSYKNGVRETLNPEGRALPPVVWDHYGQGCSIRLLNPQTFLPGLFTLNTTLQEYFHCLVGANAYLTPPNSQGFAPHYDDIEAFVLQVEGRKRWRLYKPRTENEQLPRYSSPNFSQHEIGKPIFDEVLQPGDMLYFPRGTIHQASTEPGYHSLHITLSVYQKQSYADLFERLMPLLLKRAISNSVDLRRGLPLYTWQHAGIAHSNADTKERAELLQRVTKLMGQCLHSVSMAEVLDASVDQLAKKYQHEALPPEILSSERVRTVFGSRSVTNARGECVCDYDIDARTNVRLLRAHILRLVEEEQKLRIYYYLDNSKEYCEYEPNFIEIEREEAASVEVLIRSYPEYVGVAQLPLDDEERKVQLATALWERGLLMLEKPFK